MRHSLGYSLSCCEKIDFIVCYNVRCVSDLLHDALRLYSDAGFVRLAHPFGGYAANNTSIFMEKALHR